jgi:hypothetical protein
VCQGREAVEGARLDDADEVARQVAGGGADQISKKRSGWEIRAGVEGEGEGEGGLGEVQEQAEREREGEGREGEGEGEEEGEGEGEGKPEPEG